MKVLITNSDDEHGGSGKVSYEEFEAWYAKSELSVEAEMNSFFSKVYYKRMHSVCSKKMHSVVRECIL